MTQRWLAPLTHIDTSKPQSRTSADLGIGEFNFAFSPQCQSPVFVGSPVSNSASEVCSASASETHPQKKKPDLHLCLPRLDTANHKTILSEHDLYRSDSPGIGMAFGSPSHPPPQQLIAVPGISPTSQNEYGFYLNSSEAPPATSTGKWKKIGGLLRSKSLTKKDPAFRSVQRIDAESHKLGVPVNRKRWRNPKSPLVLQDDFAVVQTDEAPPPIEKDDKYLQPDSLRPSEAKTQLPGRSIPKIEVDIPQTAMDRYSVMFKGVPGIREISSLAHQVEDPHTNEVPKAQDETKVSPPSIVRRVTSPTLPQHPNLHLRVASNNSPTSKYSLFPTTRRPHSPQSPLSNKRPSTAPSAVHRSNNSQTTLNHAHRKGNSSAAAKPPTAVLPLRNETVAPVKQKQDLHETPPEVPAKVESSRSSSAPSELFFDIKSLRDSRGNENQQYEMTRPNSGALQIARSASMARRLFVAQTNINTSLEHEEATHHSRTTSLEIDRAIAEVELLTSASKLQDVRPESPVLHDLPIIEQPRQRNDAPSVGESVIIAVEKTAPVNTPSHHKGMMRTRAGEIRIGIPSPVLEQTEESTPETTKSNFSDELSSASPPVQTNARHIAARAQSNHTPSSSSTSSLERAVPALSSNSSDPDDSKDLKEAKFIPLSKYAPRITTEVLARRTGLRPRPLARSATDDSASFNSGVRAHDPAGMHTNPQNTLNRAATMPLPELSRSKSQVGTNTSDRPNHHALGSTIHVKPAAEVSIARQVSVSKPSTGSTAGKPKVVLTRSPSLRNSPNLHNSPNPQKVQEQVAKKIKHIDINIAMIYEGEHKHKHGASLDATLDMASTRSSMLTMMHVPPVPEVSMWKPEARI